MTAPTSTLSHELAIAPRGMNSFLCSERRTSVVLALGLLPWVGVAVYAAGLSVALLLMAFAVLVFVSGYAVVSAALPAQVRTSAIALAPSAGILALSALTAFWLRLGLPLPWVSAVWMVLAAAGAVALWSDRGKLQNATADYGIALFVLSVLICALYFVPGALHDAVLRPDGSFSWFSVDTQLYQSIVASIRNSVGPPKMAGTSTAELRYHFGPYSLAAAVSLFTGIDTGDALVRVTRGVEQWALVFSCFGLGTMLSLRATGKAIGGVLSVVGLFFYGSVLSLYNGLAANNIVVPWPFLFEQAGGQVPSNGGPFSHLFFGISMLHGMEAVTAIMGLCILQREADVTNSLRLLIALILPAFMLTIHPIGAMYCLGVVAVLLFWGQLTARSWFLMAVMLGLFLGAFELMGYGHAPLASQTAIRLGNLPFNWWAFTMWFAVALGIRILSFEWVTQPLEDPLGMLVLVSFAGLLSFSWVAQLYYGTEHYGVYFLQAVFSIFAFSRLPPGFWRTDKRVKWVEDWLRIAKKGLLLFTAAGVLLAFLGYAIHRHSGIAYFRPRLLSCLLFLSLLVVLTATMKRSRRFASVGSAVIAGVLLIGFLGWLPPWARYAMGPREYNVTLAPGEVRGLLRLHELATQDERFATNKHTPTGGLGSADSYAYGTLSGRPVLIEGYADGAEIALPGFAGLLRDNDLLFSTTDPGTLRDIATAWHVQWLVARPGTDLSLPRPLPAWLVEQPDTGDLKIYRID
jgi:hypothetical protein